MNVSSLQKKMSTTQSLVLLFLVGLLSLTFLFLKIGSANAAGANPPAGSTVTTTVLSAQSIRVTLVPFANDTSTVWSFATSLNNITRTVVNVTTPTSTLTYDFTGLATNTVYYLAVASGNGVVTSSYNTSTAIYTLADNPGAPTITATGTTSFTVIINSSSNPATTTYIVRDSGGDTLQYLQGDGTWGTSSTTSFTAVQLGAINGTSTTGLTANTLHTIQVAAVNGNNVTTTFNTTSASLYTLANTPSSPSVAAGANNLTFSWSGDATQYLASDDTAGTNSGLISGTSYTVSGINCGTTRSFTVSGRNGDGVATATSTSVSGTTSACGNAIAVGGGGGATVIPATPATPAVPGVSPAVPATPAQVTLPASASAVAVFVHTLGIGSKGEEVRALQAKLRELGYFTHPTDTGVFGSVTKAAVVAFQKAQGFSSAPGVVGPATRAALNGTAEANASAAETPATTSGNGDFVSNLAVGSRGEEVRMLQAKLRELGYFTHPTDTGVFGSVTKAAVVAFQKAQGLAPFPGHVGPGTRAALNSL